MFTAAVAASGLAFLLPTHVAFGGTTGGAAPLPTDGSQTPATTPLATAQLSADGRTAIAPQNAPAQVKAAIYAANEITRKPYRYGGGHGSFKDDAYDCSGSVSYALHGGDLLSEPLDSRSFMSWGVRGPGQWITIYTNRSHAYAVIAGLRLDTSGSPSGPRWRRSQRPSTRFLARHPNGF